jgi:hypothetical protein
VYHLAGRLASDLLRKDSGISSRLASGFKSPFFCSWLLAACFWQEAGNQMPEARGQKRAARIFNYEAD